METVANCCGFDSEQNRKLQEKVRQGLLFAVFHKATGRILYLTPEERQTLPPDQYLELLKPVA